MWLLLACGAERQTDPVPDEVIYEGYVFQSPEATEETVLSEGEISFFLEDIEDPIPAEQPYTDYPGYWQVTLPSATPFEARVQGAEGWPARWAGITPSGNGIWYSGALFGADPTYLQELWAALGFDATSLAASLEGGDVVHVWGAPWDADAWDCATVSIVDGAGAALQPTCFAIDDAGQIALVDSGPFDWFFAFDAAAGAVTINSGLGSSVTYTALGGEVVFAWWFQGVPQ